jgi:acyl-CoA thioesterase-1
MARAAVGSRALAALIAAVAMLAASALSAQTMSPEPPAVPKECGDARTTDTALPNSALALERRKKIKILAIGASSAALLGTGRSGTPPLLERILERTIKGLDIEVINRGFSGELAEAAGERLKIEVALNHPDLVLWQVGTNDALAQVPVEEFQEAVVKAVRWLRSHNVDVILVGLHYMKQLAKDEHYQAIRDSLRRVASAEHVLRVGRYEAQEVLARTMEKDGQQPDQQELGPSEINYNCMALNLARSIAVGVFARAPRGMSAPSSAPAPSPPSPAQQADPPQQQPDPQPPRPQ